MWKERISQLKEFHQLHGHCHLPKDNPNFEELSSWIRQLRHFYSRFQRGLEETTVLNQECIAELGSIGLHLSATKSYRQWKRRLKELIKFEQIHGHFEFPVKSKEYKRLYGCLQHLRSEYIRRERGEDISILADLQLSQLEQIGYSFGEDPHDYSTHNYNPTKEENPIWKLRIQELKDFQQIHGHMRIPWYPEYMTLCSWVNYCRCEYLKYLKGETSRLTGFQIKQLTDMGFELTDKQIDVLRKQRIQKLKKSRQTNRNRRVPSKLSGNKSCYVGNPNSTLRPLSQEAEWIRRLEELKQFHCKYGHSNVPCDTAEYKSLWGWIQRTRQEFKKRQRGEPSRLSDDCIRQLKENSRERKQNSQKIAIQDHYSARNPASESSDGAGIRTSAVTVTPARQHAPQECVLLKGMPTERHDGSAARKRPKKQVRFDSDKPQENQSGQQDGSRRYSGLERSDNSQAAVISPSTTRPGNHRRLLPTRRNVASPSSLQGGEEDPSIGGVAILAFESAIDTCAMKQNQESHRDVKTDTKSGCNSILYAGTKRFHSSRDGGDEST